MPRANRHYIPGCVWHITHRCHKKEFLLKFARDRRRYLQWLFEAKKRFGLSELNYMVTSNHIHLLVRDIGERDVIPNSIQLIAGRTGQEYNQRKDRKGAYWEDRYHATALSPSTRNESSAGIRGKRSENGREPPGLCKSVGMRHDVAYLSLLR
jgi:putative transposase